MLEKDLLIYRRSELKHLSWTVIPFVKVLKPNMDSLESPEDLLLGACDMERDIDSDEARDLLTESAQQTPTQPISTANPMETMPAPRGIIPIEAGDEKRMQRLEKAQKHIRVTQRP